MQILLLRCKLFDETGDRTPSRKRTNDLENAEKKMHNFSRPLPSPPAAPTTATAVCFGLLACAGFGNTAHSYRGARRESGKIVNNSLVSHLDNGEQTEWLMRNVLNMGTRWS